MKILYDGYIYNTQAAGGINRYFTNLIHRLPGDFLPALSTYQIRTVNWPHHPNLKIFQFKRFRPSRISAKLEKPYFNVVNGLFKHDIMHPTYYSSLSGCDWNTYRRPIVLTVYDMVHERFAEMMDPTGTRSEIKRKAILSAQAIICISEHTKKDLMEIYSVPESKITVTYLAAEFNYDQTGGGEIIPARPYFLYVGSRAPYKNFDVLLRAFAKVVSKKDDIGLNVAGPSLTLDEGRLIAELGLEGHIKHYGHISDSHLAKLYRGTLALVYPSFYEGFGIPPLEAMMCGTVVVASDSSSIPEVVGDAGLLFNPYRSEDLADILLSLLNRSVDRDLLIKKGFERANKFSWDKTVSQTLDVYRAVAE